MNYKLANKDGKQYIPFSLGGRDCIIVCIIVGLARFVAPLALKSVLATIIMEIGG